MTTENKKDLTLSDKYKLKGAQQMTYAEYQAFKAKSKKAKFVIPVFVKYILGTPLFIIFLFGILFIPYMLYVIATSPAAPVAPEKSELADATTR